MLYVLNEEKNHDFDGIQSSIDDAIKHYISNMFDVHHDEQVLQ